MDDSENKESKMNGSEQFGQEAEDIVADAIKLEVDDDLNEQREDHALENSSNFQSNGNADNTNIEDEPNYEVDEEHYNEQYDENYDEHYDEEQDYEQNDEQYVEDESSKNKDDILKEDKTNETNDKPSDNTNDKTNDNSTDKNELENKDQDSKSNEVKTDNQKDENKDSKKDSNESDSKSTKLKSSSSKDRDKSSERKSSSNDKIVLVSGLSSDAKASDLLALFKKHVKVNSAKIIKNTKLPGSKCYGVITLETNEQAEKAIQALNKTEFDGKTITVEKNKFSDEKKSDKETKDSDSKKDDKSKDKRDRSPKRRSYSPAHRRFQPYHYRPNYSQRRIGPPPPFGFRRGMGPRAPFGGPPMGRRFDDHMLRKREFEKRRAEESYRRQRDLERRQQEERDKIEREKMRLKIEKDRLEREFDFMRMEREKARKEREIMEREREELRRKQMSQLPPSISRLDDSRSSRPSLTSKRPYDEIYSSASSSLWDDRKHFEISGNPSLTSTRTFDTSLETGFNANYAYTDIHSSTDYDRRSKLEVGSLSALTRDSKYDTKRLETNRRHEPDDRRATNGAQLNYFKDNSNRSRDTRRGSRDDSDWKANLDRRPSDSRFLDKSSLTPQSSYLSSNRTGSYGADAWASAPDRVPPASSNLGKPNIGISHYPSVTSLNDSRARQPVIPQNLNSTSTIGMYPNVNLSGMINSNYGNSNNLNSNYRRY